MDDSLRIRFIGLGIQLTLVGGMLMTLIESIGLTLVVLGTFVTVRGVF